MPPPQKHLRYQGDSDSELNSNVGSGGLNPRKKLKISIDEDSIFSPAADSPDSLFDEISSSSARSDWDEDCDDSPATLHAPAIPGLFFVPSLIPHELAHQVNDFCMRKYFSKPGVNQIMLFGVAASSGCAPTSGLPPLLRELLSTVSDLLALELPPEVHALLFPPSPTYARQAILNLYRPGEGIAPHVDLPARFGDGIVGVSLGSGCAMRFTEAETDGAEAVRLFLPAQSVLVLSGEARYGWTHGIEQRTADFVKGEGMIERGTRMSITFRWLLPGADVVGDPDDFH
ncbi:hypothetical protein B0H15DRAFT_869301 [Mycena belliarum]|uniref:Fe2OG dioxygenase domain-containing protein n=1 Tax=Mycena belliarum TaxID=1033014 RepID=A0AAD6TQ05_9AGAR|nr:hypothetical protein B0H15DRAFT_869301 [Mycena belliae]